MIFVLAGPPYFFDGSKGGRVVACRGDGASPARVSFGDFLGEFFDASACFRVFGISGIR